ncbi:unnamed protein product [Angiostrongylus costaricensis]|uniref:Uncharacterized protein n=1 Tax=Angiostrongylus costaricensis TaxID=334426 RepID=A0A158PE74_ANGCS|nr:unnamed protein product [Angiostrongylus costaricensis]
MSPSGGDPYRSPPIIRKRTAFPLTIIFRKLFGLLITILAMFILVAGIPVYLILDPPCLIQCLIRCSNNRNSLNYSKLELFCSFNIECCTHQWPICGTSPDLAGMIFTGTVDLETINKELRRVILDSESNLFVDCSSNVAPNIGKLWDQSAYRLTADDKLLELLLQRNVLPVGQMSVSLVPGFEHSLKGLVTSSLLLTSTAADCPFVCTQRLLCMCVNEKTSFEIGSHTPVNGLQQHVFGRLPQTAICMSCKETFESAGTSFFVVNADECSSGEHEFRHEKPDTLVRPAVHRRSWMTVEHPELLFRAEKLLRANTCELLLSLVAGALRNYFRGQGILHPPDLGCVIPFSARDLTAVGDCCETNLLPLELPTSVEGAIPRLWAVQKRVAKVVRGPMSGAIAVARGLARLCLPASAAKCALRVFYRSHGVYFAFYRISSDAHLQTTFAFPSLTSSLRAAFVFVQHGNIIDMSVSLCSNTFPDLERVLYSFQRETRLLLDHLSLRLLSLPQITVLPGLTACLGRERTENESNNESFIRHHINREFIDDHVDEYSLEELYRLLDVVQSDLDSMRSNPESNRRGHYIQRLTSLEEKMQKFHECISQKLSAETIGLASGDDEVGDAIANVLAPYRDEPGQPSYLDRFRRKKVSHYR